MNKANKKEFIIGLASGSGKTAKSAISGGVDIILALNSGRFRQMGISSLAGFLPFYDCNKLVMEFGSREILPIVKDFPVIFGLCATDPTINLEHYIHAIKMKGFAGINNYPSVGLIDGQYREGLEEQGISFETEVKAIKIAHGQGLFTIAFVFDNDQAKQMLDAGADVICAHLGFTKGGILGAKKALSLVEGVRVVNEIFKECDHVNREVIKMIYGGPVSTPSDLKYMQDNTGTMGYIGGSAFERIPTEHVLSSTIQKFKNIGQKEADEFLMKMLNGAGEHYEYAEFVKEYIAVNYMMKVSLEDLAQLLHISRPYLSKVFKLEVGCSYSTYLMEYRMHKSIEFISQDCFQLAEVANMTGFSDYAHFSKAFKKYVGQSPREYVETLQKHMK
ncbi:phosphoenolpyruvate hydrolase family protein [Sporosarcina sp. BI001-red]|uniref:phosphoenolpyruvate hydrolase family protein n=1 Tax=Sporosarcina sp. BI001-red TaxID=2282866 RepID=UPI001F2C6C55|nr:phosphoenolpyruvate hydrolase family protein [Sporosarcina sp. BI001-red]